MKYTRRIRSAWLLAVLLSGVALLAQKAEDAEVLLQKAIQTETIDGDLPSAIAQYQKIVDIPGVSRAVAAKALYRLAHSQERIGDPKAAKSYARVAQNFTDQTDLASLARKRLATLTLGDAGNDSSLKMHRLFGEMFISPRRGVSANGMLVAYIGADEAGFRVFDRNTGQSHRLPQKPDGLAYIEPLVSNGGKLVAYTQHPWPYWSEERPQSHLGVMGIEGDQQRTLNGAGGFDIAYFSDWSEDDQRLLAIVRRSPEKPVEIVEIDLSNEQVRRVQLEDGGRFQNALYCADGKHVVIQRQTEKGSSESVFSIVPLAGGTPVPLFDKPAVQELIGIDRHNRVVFRSDRMGTTDAWMIPIHDGRPAGSPEVVRKGVGDERILGLTPDGAYLYSVSTNLFDVFTADINPDPGSVAEARPVSDRFVGASFTPDYSWDGKDLVYLSGTEDSGRRQIVIRDLENGEERYLSAPLPDIKTIRWYPDGKALVIYGRDQQERFGFWKMDAETGELATVKLLLNHSHRDSATNPSFSPDGKTLYFKNWTEGGKDYHTFISALDLASGEVKIAYDAEKPSLVRLYALSPSGKSIAFGLRDGNGRDFAGVVPVSGGEARILFECPKEDYMRGFSGIGWTADENAILIHKVAYPGDELWKFPVDGSEPQKLLQTGIIRHLRTRPDGRQLVFEAHRWRNDVWALENWLPPVSSQP